MYDIVCPGLTKERGLTLFEIFSATFQIIKLQASSIMNGVNSSSGRNSGKFMHLRNSFVLDIKILRILYLLNNLWYPMIFRETVRGTKSFHEPREKTWNGRRIK